MKELFNAQFFEVLMLICFGLSWPFNIAKSWKSRTAKGKSVLFELMIIIGYGCGVAGKIIGGNITYVVIVYALDILMVATDLILTLRNKVLDRIEDKKREKALAELTKAARKDEEPKETKEPKDVKEEAKA